MLLLADEQLLVRLDPSHGGEIVDLLDLRSGRQLLARAPAAPGSGLRGQLPDEETWCRGYRGGWQLLTPNAGNACVVDGSDHGFHGASSTEPWRVSERLRSRCRLSWSGGGLEVERELELCGGEVAVQTSWRSHRSRAAFIAVEHVAVGRELLAPAMKIELPGGSCFQQSETMGPIAAPADAPAWPQALMLDGSVSPQQDAWAISEARAHVLTVAQLPRGQAELRRRGGGGMRLQWDLDAMPHLWIWHEVRASGGIWCRQAEILGLEPASVPHGLGLAAAVEAGQATLLREGEHVSSWVRLKPLR